MTDHLNENTPIENPPEEHDDLSASINRLGGEPAPDISAEEFARLQASGSVHLDPFGRVRANRREESDPGVSLRKRRAWYSWNRSR